MNSRVVDPWDTVFYPSLPVDADRLSKSRPQLHHTHPHSAINNIRYLAFIDANLGNFRKSYQPPFTIAQEIERLHSDALSVGIDIYEQSPAAVRFLANFVSGWFGVLTIDPRTVKFKSQFDGWLAQHQDEVNPHFVSNFTNACNAQMPLSDMAPEGINDQIEIANEINKRTADLALQDKVSFLTRECLNLMRHYDSVLNNNLKKNKKVYELRDSINGAEKLIVMDYIKKHPKDLVAPLEKYQLINELYHTLQKPELSRLDKLEIFANQFKKAEKILEKHRDGMLKRFGKVCLFCLTTVLTFGLAAKPAYTKLFQPRGKAYTKKIRGLELVEPDEEKVTRRKRSK